MHRAVVALIVAALASACHSEIENVPLTQQNVYFSDKFYDVAALGPEHAIIVGYGGKVLETRDGGLSFIRLQTGTELALFDISVKGEHLWIAGQEGLILHSPDGGKTFEQQKSGTENYLFAVHFLNEQHGFAVGDRSVLSETVDGGKTWQARTLEVARSAAEMASEANPDLELAMQDPVLYDVRFLNDQVGWVVGEFGRILRTDDGGKTWKEQQATLMSAETGIVDPMDIPTFFGITVLSDKEAIVSGLEGRIARTSDGGKTWAFDAMKLEYPIVDPLYVSYVTPDGTSWAAGAAGEVVTRRQGEPVWTRAEMGMSLFTWIRSIDFADAQSGWLVGGYGNILHTTDGGKSWRVCLG